MSYISVNVSPDLFEFSIDNYTKTFSAKSLILLRVVSYLMLCLHEFFQQDILKSRRATML